jgi:hypothetical protein
MTMHQENLPPLQDPAFLEMMALFTEKNYWQRLRLMFAGLGKPKDSREYKLAHTELQRQVAPLAAIVLPTICIVLLAIFANAKSTDDRIIETEIMEVEELKELEEILDKEPLPDDIQPTDIVFTPEIAMNTPAPTPDAPMSPQPQAFDSVMQVRSPVILRNIFGSTRSAGMRGQLITGGGGNASTEAAVMRALRWLKTKQLPDGSWPKNKSAMTAMAILCYLAHGEKPGESEEFGDTVQRGIEFLLTSQPANGQWRGNYEHYIATYALCEAYGMTMNPNVKSAVDRAVKLIIDGQHVSGGWDYGLKPGERDDTSVMGWAAQALKAAKMADFYSDPEALERACKLAVKGFQKNASPAGGFGYTGPAGGGLSSVGTLCMQFHNAGNYPEVKKTFEAVLDLWEPVWNGSTPLNRLGSDAKPVTGPTVPGPSTQYYFYYATQAMFQSGGSRWKKWNEKMWHEYVKAQFIEEKAIADMKGVMQDIGWWENADHAGSDQRPVMDTCLAALQLMVYYRYLPTFKSVAVPEEVVATAQDSADIKVDVNL